MSAILPPFTPFPKLPRLNRECIITEKLDGSNAQVLVLEDGTVVAGSRNRYLTPTKTGDNFGFAAWVQAHEDQLRELGPGAHFGEWWGRGIQRGYDMEERRFSLFNVDRWTDAHPECCDVVPVLYRGPFATYAVKVELGTLVDYGSVAAPGFLRPEGLVVWHTAARHGFKVTIEGDEAPKKGPRSAHDLPPEVSPC